MATTNGIYTLEDLRSANFSSAIDYGMDKILPILQNDLAQYNSYVNEVLAYMCGKTTKQAMIWGSSSVSEFTEMDEFGKPVAKRENLGSSVMFPIRKYMAGIFFSRDFWETATGNEIAEKMITLEQGHFEKLLSLMKSALFNSTNYSFTDPYTQQVLSVKRLLNADSTPIPQYGGQTFTASSHSHYLGTSSLSGSNITTLTDHVIEHGHKNVQIQINAANRTAFEALTGFTAVTPVSLIPQTDENATVARVDVANVNPTNRYIGDFKGYPVWVKPSPQIPENYILAVSVNNADPVLMMRERVQPKLQGLMLDAPVPSEPLLAEEARFYAGFGVNNRSAAAVLYTANATYSDPG